jgi:two-component system alkaline phosphatase synthesis response regulator PhoP
MNKTILIVDDEEDIRTILSEHFEDQNFNVVTAEDGQDGIEKLESNNIDVILSDIKMPRLDGIEFSKKAKGLKSHVPIFLITAFSEYTEKDILAIGVEAIVFKPFDIDEIVELVNDTLNKEVL